MKKRRPAVLAISIGLVLAAVAGVLGVLHAMAPDREAIREQLALEISRIEALPANDPVRKDRRIHELQAVEDYKVHARTLWLNLERLHGPLHQAAMADDAARKSVPPFLARCTTLTGKSPAELRSLDDEARALQDEHGSTRFGPALVEVRQRLSLAKATGLQTCSELDHFRLLQDAQKERIGAHFAQALTRIDESISKHPQCEQFLVRLRKERMILLASANRAVEALLEQARNDRRDGRKEEAAQSLERALPNFKGLPDEGRLKALLAELRRP